MQEEINRERHLITMIIRCCLLSGEDDIAEVNISLYTDLCCIDFPFDNSWIVLHSPYFITDLDTETRVL